MSGILEEGTERYIHSLLPRRERVVEEMESYARTHNTPIIGPACGRLLYQLARLIRARRVFEMGSAIGYSCLWLAQAVGPQGTVFYTDNDPENARRARTYLQRSGLLRRVQLLVGDALALLKATRGQFDLIFNDVSKTQYPEVFRLALPRVRIGGLFVTDNVLLSGKLALPANDDDAKMRAIRKFNRLIYRSPKLFTTIIPLRDGFAVCQRIR